MQNVPLKELLFIALGSLVLLPVHAQTVYTATLNGASEVPPVATDASGSCTAILNATGTQLDIGCTYQGVDPVEPAPNAGAAHIHNAPAGQNGSIVFSLEPGLNRNGFDGFDGDIQASWALTAADVTALEAGDLYVNIHSAANPGGEIRGQWTPVGSGTALTFNFPLTGAQEVPPVETTASGQCEATLDATASSLSLSCTHDLTTAAPGGHIHIGATGSNGPIVFNLPNLGASPIDTVWSVNPPVVTNPAPNRPLTPDLVAALLAGDLYVNLHSATNPGGELRGQIVDATAPAPVGIPTLSGLAIVLVAGCCGGLALLLLRRRQST